MPRHCAKTRRPPRARVSRVRRAREALLLLHDDDHRLVRRGVQRARVCPDAAQAQGNTNEVHARASASKGRARRSPTATRRCGSTKPRDASPRSALTTRQVDREVRRSAKHAALRTLAHTHAAATTPSRGATCGRSPAPARASRSSCSRRARRAAARSRRSSSRRRATARRPRAAARAAAAPRRPRPRLRRVGGRAPPRRRQKTARAQGRVRAVATWLLLAHFLSRARGR